MNATKNANGTTVNAGQWNEKWVEPKVGSVVKTDGTSRLPVKLLAGDDFVDAGFPGCDFRFPNPVREWETKHAIAVNVTVTGRTTQRKDGADWVRVCFEWVGDCEPSTYSRGWMLVE